MTVGLYSLELHLPTSRSLKDKRQVVRRLKDRVRARHNVSVAETADYQNLRQRGELMFAAVADRREPLEKLFEAIYQMALIEVPGDVIENGTDFLDMAGGMDGDWE